MSFCLLMFILVFAFTPSSSACLEVLEELEEVLGCWGMRGWVKELLPREGGWEGGLEGGLEGGCSGAVLAFQTAAAAAAASYKAAAAAAVEIA